MSKLCTCDTKKDRGSPRRWESTEMKHSGAGSGLVQAPVDGGRFFPPSTFYVSVLHGIGRIHEALEVPLADLGQSGRHVIQFSFAHPFLQPVHEFEEMVEAVHDKQQRLIMVDLCNLIYDPFYLERIALHLVRFDGVLQFTERA